VFRKVLVPYDDAAEYAVPLLFAQTIACATSADIAAVHAASLDEILHAIAASDADLVVLAMRRIAEQIVHRSYAPVVVVRPDGIQPTALKKLLVPVDGSRGAAVALSTAIGLARQANADVIVVEVAVRVPRWAYAAVSGGGMALPPESAWDEDTRVAAQGDIERLVQRLRRAGLSVQGRVGSGDRAQTIVSVADETDADLIVMSTRALVGPARIIRASTADAVARDSRRPVLLVRRDYRDRSATATARK
jgi:nucleotide-binding universal stress UspA family protein